MTTPTVVFFAVLIATAALVQAAPVWQQQEDNVNEELIQVLTKYLIEKAEKISAVERKMASQQQGEARIQTNGYPMFGWERQMNKLTSQDLPMFNTKLREQGMFKPDFIKQEVDFESSEGGETLNDKERNLLAEIVRFAEEQARE